MNVLFYLFLFLLIIIIIIYYMFSPTDRIKKNENRYENKIGFIILRHVNNKVTNKYWIRCYKSIRRIYPENNILIIDDNSNYDFITYINLYKTTIINSEYPGRGELLPYYYFLKLKPFETAVILHDSVFINEYINFNVDTYKFIWCFKTHKYDQIEDETKMIKIFEDQELLDFYENKNLWNGCFGGMSIITYEYLNYINSKYDISKLLPYVLKRYNRCSFERVIACLLQKDHIQTELLGDIHKYCAWGITFYNFYYYTNLPMTKVWSGR